MKSRIAQFILLAIALLPFAPAAEAVPLVCRTKATEIATRQLHLDLLDYEVHYEVYMGEGVLESIEPETYNFPVELTLLASYSYRVAMDASRDCRFLKIERIDD